MTETKEWGVFLLFPVAAYVLQVKVEMELEIQQYEKAKAVREEQLDRLTQICQEQAVNSIGVSCSSTCNYTLSPAEGNNALWKKRCDVIPLNASHKKIPLIVPFFSPIQTIKTLNCSYYSHYIF